MASSAESGKGDETMARKTTEDVLQSVREAVELGWTYDDIRLATGVSYSVIAEVKRQLGLLPPTLHRTTNDMLAAAKEMVLTGQEYAVIREETGVSRSAIKTLRKEAGLVKARPGVIPDAMASAVRDAISTGLSYSQIKTKLGVSASIIADLKREMGLIPQLDTVPAPATEPASPTEPTAPDPSEYFHAIRDGILDGYAREQALSDRGALLQARITELESQNKRLQDALTQTRARMSSWAGPMPLPNRNLSTGG
jgi:uncharacterized protein YerC